MIIFTQQNNDITPTPSPTPTPISVYVEGLEDIKSEMEAIKGVQTQCFEKLDSIDNNIYDGLSGCVFLLFVLVFFEVFRFIKGLFKEDKK